MKVAITGATGFLGAALATLASRDADLDVALVSRDMPPHLASCAWIPHDNHAISKLRDFDPASIIHSAALSSAAVAEQDPCLAWNSNVALTASLAELSRELASHFVYVSTDLVFDGIREIPPDGIDETIIPCPASVYARTKYAGELAAQTCCSSTTVARASLIYGASHGTRPGPLAWMLDAAKDGFELSLFSDEWRTPIYVVDLAKQLLHFAKQKIPGTFHMGGPNRVSRVELGQAVLSTFGFSTEGIIAKTRSQVSMAPPRPRDVSLNSNAAVARIPFELHSLSDGLRATVEDMITAAKS